MTRWILALVTLVALSSLPMQSRCYIDAQTGRMICCDRYGMCV